MRITRYFMERPTLFWSFIVGILLAGIIAFNQMPKLEDPAVAVKQAMVIIPCQGASAHEVELKVAQPMEDVLRTLPQVRRIKSTCVQNMAQITVEYDLATKNSDLEQYFDLLRRKVNDNKAMLPQDCINPIVLDDMMDVYGIFYSFSGEGYSYDELEKYAKYIHRELLKVKGVKRITIGGTQREVINIIMEPDKIAQNGLIPTQIMMQLQSAGAVVNAGNYETGDQRLMVSVNDAIKDENDIRNLQISTVGGGIVRLGDIARVERSYVEPQTRGFWADGKQALAICVSLSNDANVPKVGAAVDELPQRDAADPVVTEEVVEHGVEVVALVLLAPRPVEAVAPAVDRVPDRIAQAQIRAVLLSAAVQVAREHANDAVDVAHKTGGAQKHAQDAPNGRALNGTDDGTQQVAYKTGPQQRHGKVVRAVAAVHKGAKGLLDLLEERHMQNLFSFSSNRSRRGHSSSYTAY